MLQTSRLLIKPLNYSQLQKYMLCDGTLETELNLLPNNRSISAELMEAFENTILPNVANNSKNYLYCTLWTAISVADNKMVADLCITDEPNADGEIEIGYGTYDEFQNKGYMTEVVAAIVAWAKTQAAVKSIIASTSKTNTASFKVLQNNNFIKVFENEEFFNWQLKW